jgi:hypothetical protein
MPEGGHAQGRSHLAGVDACNSLPVPIISSQLMSRLAPALLGCVLHLEPVALLLLAVKAGEVGDRRRELGGRVRGWAHSSSWKSFGVVGAECLALLQEVCGVQERECSAQKG